MNPSQQATIHENADHEPSAQEDEFDGMFEEVDLFSTALIQGGCTDQASY